MRRLNIPTLASGIAATGEIGPNDVEILRQNLLDGEEIWPHEARAMFDLMHKRLPACGEWLPFFVDAMSGYVLNHLEPHGRMDERNARWLIAMLKRDDSSAGKIELALMLRVLENISLAPANLQAFALEMVRKSMAGDDEAADAGAQAEAAGPGHMTLRLVSNAAA